MKLVYINITFLLYYNKRNFSWFLDEKEKYDPTGFRDAILQGLNESGSDLELVSKFLDTAGSKLDYRRYGETLFDILLAGGILGKILFKILLFMFINDILKVEIIFLSFGHLKKVFESLW